MSTSEVIEAEHGQPEGRGGPPVDGKFTVQVGDEALDFQPVEIADPVPTARQIIDAVGFRPAEEHLVFQVTHDRCLKELKLDETTDVRDPDSEHFLVFRSDRSFRGLIDGKRFEWGVREIRGDVLKWIAGVDPETHGVWLTLRDEPDQLIGDDDKASLTPTGVERFRTDLMVRLCIEDDFYPWPRGTITTEEIAALGGWDPAIGVIEVDAEQNERTLEPGEVIKLRPGVSFGKKLCFKRGLV